MATDGPPFVLCARNVVASRTAAILRLVSKSGPTAPGAEAAIPELAKLPVSFAPSTSVIRPFPTIS